MTLRNVIVLETVDHRAARQVVLEPPPYEAVQGAIVHCLFGRQLADIAFNSICLHAAVQSDRSAGKQALWGHRLRQMGPSRVYARGVATIFSRKTTACVIDSAQVACW